MERLRKQDVDAGVERQVVTPKQKAAIAEIRRLYEGMLAELDDRHERQMRSLFDPSERASVDAQYRHARERMTSELEAKVAAARSEP